MADENINIPQTRAKLVIPMLNLVLVIIILSIFAIYTDFKKIAETLIKTNLPIYALSILMSLLMIYTISGRLSVVVKKQGIEISVLKLTLINLGIRFYSTFSPISSIGMLMRWNRIVPQGKSAEGLAALAINRLLDVVLAIGFGIFWGMGAASEVDIHPVTLTIYFILFLALIWGMLKASRVIVLWAGSRKSTAKTPISTWIFNGLEKISHSLSLYSSLSTAEISAVLATALITEVLGMAAHLITAASIGIQISFIDMGWIRALVFLAALTPLTLPGGFGIREISMAVILSSFGIETEKAAAYSVLLYAKTLIIALIGGAIELFFNLSKLRDV